MLNFLFTREVTWLFAINFIIITFLLCLVVNFIYYKFSDKKERKAKAEELSEQDNNIIDKEGD